MVAAAGLPWPRPRLPAPPMSGLGAPKAVEATPDVSAELAEAWAELHA
jgi:hypothetical protein